MTHQLEFLERQNMNNAQSIDGINWGREGINWHREGINWEGINWEGINWSCQGISF